MIFTYYVIKGLKKGVWFYFRLHEDRDRQWDTDLYIAHKLKTYDEASAFLMNMIKTYHWGGYFQIEETFVSK